MDLMNLGKQLLASKLGSGADSGALSSALGGLLSGNDGKTDLGGIISAMQDKGLGSVAESWLGDRRLVAGWPERCNTTDDRQIQQWRLITGQCRRTAGHGEEIFLE